MQEVYIWTLVGLLLHFEVIIIIASHITWKNSVKNLPRT